MNRIAKPQSSVSLEYLNLERHGRTIWNLTPPELYEEIIQNGEAKLTNDYVLRVLTGEYTGRSPKDKFIVNQSSIHNDINWGKINQPISEDIFDHLFEEVTDYLQDKKLYAMDCFAGAEENYQLNVRIVSEVAYHALFVHNMFIRPTEDQLQNFAPEFTVLVAPHFQADPVADGTRSEAFILVNFDKKIILIGGTLYSGEIKKGIFSVMNFLLPKQDVMAMHCSSNMNKDGETAIFFGLSGTGKTTLSSDPNRILIGDDEHGWSENGIFNIEGGCYAKTINLSAEEEPLIYATTKMPGAIIENVPLDKQRDPDFDDTRYTQNTRCSYPIDYLPNAKEKSVGDHPNNIIFLTCDAFGVLPPISKLTPRQAMYHFISGYTAKVAGTEQGVSEPQATFSACFGAPFMPLHPTVYARLLADKIRDHNAGVWLINTGWTGGPYSQGHRIKLDYTRKMLSEALKGNLNDVEFETDEIFGLQIPKQIKGIPNDLLRPRNTWDNKTAYDKRAKKLAQMFSDNFKQFEEKASQETIEAGPTI